MNTAQEIYLRAQACLVSLPIPEVSAVTAEAYRTTFHRMMTEEPVLDPLRPGDARDTFDVRRASSHWGAAPCSRTC
jgi:hypothetical protein